jgi:hypothetical protein
VRYAGEDTPSKWYVVEARQTVGYLVVSDVSHPAYLWEEVSVTIFHASLGKAHQRLDPASLSEIL